MFLKLQQTLFQMICHHNKQVYHHCHKNDKNIYCASVTNKLTKVLHITESMKKAPLKNGLLHCKMLHKIIKQFY